MAQIPAARQGQARPARLQRRLGRQDLQGPRRSFASTHRQKASLRRPPPRPRTLGGRPHGLLEMRPEHPPRPRAKDPHPASRPPTLQARRGCRPPPRPMARTPAAATAQKHDLRQWNRVRPPPQAQRKAQGEDLLLRSPQPLAERRHRKRHRPHAQIPAAQNRPRRPAARLDPRCRRTLQQHPAKMPWLENPRRGILTPPQTVALGM